MLIRDKFEPGAVAAAEANGDIDTTAMSAEGANAISLMSIAFSLKRIADGLDRVTETKFDPSYIRTAGQ